LTKPSQSTRKPNTVKTPKIEKTTAKTEKTTPSPIHTNADVQSFDDHITEFSSPFTNKTHVVKNQVPVTKCKLRRKGPSAKINPHQSIVGKKFRES